MEVVEKSKYPPAKLGALGFEPLKAKLDERGRRVFAAGEVRAAGWGGLEAVSEITGLAARPSAAA